jgi:DNA-binding response OmpR family regulator
MRILFHTNPHLAQTLRPALEGDGFTVDVAGPTGGEPRAPAPHYQAVLLDTSLLSGTGYACLLRWRRAGLRAHVLALLPRESTSAERVECLDAGADAYLLSPLAAPELQAHLRVLRRREGSVANPVRHVHDLEINMEGRTVKRGGRPIRLTPREFDLLEVLACHQGRVVSRSTIRAHLYEGDDDAGSNVVDVYVRYLRNKIDKGFAKPLILTRWGQGYLLRPENG